MMIVFAEKSLTWQRKKKTYDLAKNEDRIQVVKIILQTDFILWYLEVFYQSKITKKSLIRLIQTGLNF